MEQQLVFPRRETTAHTRRFGFRNIHILSIFFATDRSPDNRQVIDIQRRAGWIALALILQAINEGLSLIPQEWYQLHLPAYKPWAGTVSFLLVLGSFVMMWMAFRPMPLHRQTRRVAGRPYRWQRIVLILVLITSLVGIIDLGRGIYLAFFAPPQYTNDGTSLDTNAAMVLLQGQNPYVDSNMIHIARLFAIDPTWTTPLRQGQFANRLDYPSPVEIRTIFDTDMKSGLAPEFESKVSYPSLSFLSLVPFIWLGIYNVLGLYLLCYVALVAIGWKVARKEMRPWIIVFALANVSMWSSVVGGNLDVVMILLIVVAWLWRDRRWLSALALGLAMACKQPAWFFVPFYVILIWREQNRREACLRLVIAGSLALVINLPFIIWNPGAWLAGVLAPMADPMFPLGVGLVNLSSYHLLPYLPSWVYLSLEAGAMVGMLACYWRICRERPEAAMLLAVVPLFLAWRSLPSYFSCTAFPLFLLMAARKKTSTGIKESGHTQSARAS